MEIWQKFIVNLYPIRFDTQTKFLLKVNFSLRFLTDIDSWWTIRAGGKESAVEYTIVSTSRFPLKKLTFKY